MGAREVFSTFRELIGLASVVRYLRPAAPDAIRSIGLQFEETATRFGERPAVVFEGRTVTWAELNAMANRYGHFLRDQGVTAGDTVSIFMENRVEFLAAMVGVVKLGAIGGLINTNLRGRPLVHCINVTESKKCLFGSELAEALAPARAELTLEDGEDFLCVPEPGDAAPEWALDVDTLSAHLSTDNPDSTETVRAGDSGLYIFTSGTTGLPKAAVLSHRRFLASGASSWKPGLKLTETDRLYLCLPLYHGTALLIGFGSSLYSGASMFLRRRFSASRFLDEAREHGTTAFVYIGEICRYLMQRPTHPDDADNPIDRMMGNGLRPDVWLEFKERYGIDRVTEFYGSSEGNVAFANLLNKDRTIGMTVNKIALVAYDVDADEIVRDPNGRCIRVAKGEPGLLLAQINKKAVFEGYTNAEATESKIVRDAFEPGDAWFNSGDLIKRIDAGFAVGIPHYQFVDRVGDTFRWKSENVSTNEVGEIINQHPSVQLANVYGVEVPRADGRAGMAAITLETGLAELDLEDFSAFVARELPAYARPVFVRVQDRVELTGTFKLIKGDLRKQAYDLDQVADPVYVMKPGSASYAPLDRDFLEQIRSGAAGY